MTTDTQEHVLNEAGEFDVHDEPVDLTHYRFEDWTAFAIFWGLAVVIFYHFFTRYSLNNSAAWTEGIARYLLIAVAFAGAAGNGRKNNRIKAQLVSRRVPAHASCP